MALIPPIAPPATLASGPVSAAEAIMRERARSFALAARLLPVAQRRPTAVLYAFYRSLDDLVDEPAPGWSRERVAAELDRWEAWLRAGLPADGPGPLCAEVRAVVHGHGIPLPPLLAMVEGQRADLWHQPPPTFAALERYCQQVASSVGEAMCYVLGTPTPAALAAARDLGVAMQLTNILRDVGEDLIAGRCYLPVDELDRFGLGALGQASAQQAASADAALSPSLDGSDRSHPRSPWESAGVSASDPALVALLQQQVQRARAYYVRGRRGIWLLPPSSRPAILLAARLYERILDCVERNRYDVFTRRAHTGRAEKARVILGCVAELGLQRVVRTAG